MFGDLFSQRGDYLEGMFYRGHMKYLREQTSESALMPPDEFKTRRQKHNVKRNSGSDNKSEQVLNFIKFQKKQEEESHHSKFKKAAHIVQDMIMLEHFSSNLETDWILRKEAGVVIWINKNTGEVSSVRPWEDAAQAKERRMTVAAAAAAAKGRNAASKHGVNSTLIASESVPSAASSVAEDRSGSHKNIPQDAIDDELGTGSLVYDKSELDNFFALLDEMK
jgi:hypothetical protein